MNILRASTAVTLKIGPFLDCSDMVTPEEGLTILQADVKLSKNGASLVAKSEDSEGVYDADGLYAISLDADDTDTVGSLCVSIQKAGAVPVSIRYSIASEDYYDFFAGESCDANVVSVNSVAVTAPGDFKADVSDLSLETTTLKILEDTSDLIPVTLDSIIVEVATVLADTVEILNYQAGDWKIENDQMIFYDTTGDELKRFNLFKDGSPDSDSPDERVGV